MTALLLAIAIAPTADARPAENDEVDADTKARVLGAIEAYVKEDEALKEKFLVLDPRSDEPLVALSFDHVHAGVHPHEQGYRACVDFTDDAGDLYDVDVVVSLDDQEGSTVQKVWLHKVAGEAVEAPSD